MLLSAAFFKNSVSDKAFEKARNTGVLLRSSAAIKELVSVMNRQKFDKYLKLKDREAFIRKYIVTARPVNVTHSVRVCRDGKDNKFLELALSGHADCIITGDQDLLVLHPFENIPIVTPADFLNIF